MTDPTPALGLELSLKDVNATPSAGLRLVADGYESSFTGNRQRVQIPLDVFYCRRRYGPLTHCPLRLSGAAPGTYNVLITDSALGCTATAAAMVASPLPLRLFSLFAGACRAPGQRG